MSPNEPEITVKVFICYSHADQELRQEIEEVYGTKQTSTTRRI